MLFAYLITEESLTSLFARFFASIFVSNIFAFRFCTPIIFFPIPKMSDSANKVKYDVMINRPNNYIFPEITFDDVDNYDFNNNGFIEVLKAPEYVHLYFDFDKMKTADEDKDKIEVSEQEQMQRFDDVICWLDSLKPIFGEYSIGGYTDN